MATQSIAELHSSPESSDRKSPETTSPSLTTAPSPAASATAHSMANASRGLAGTPGIAPCNYFLQPGTRTPKELISEIKEGLYVTEFLGHGANLVTGDYSRGASGLWISGGELAFPVDEINV